MNSEVSFRHIEPDEWQKGDYRPLADIYWSTEELFAKYKLNFIEYLEEGLGKVKSAYLVNSKGRQFIISQYVESSSPLTEISALHNKETMAEDLNDILQFLNLNRSDLGFIHKFES